jgi:hypothetical protein
LRPFVSLLETNSAIKTHDDQLDAVYGREDDSREIRQVSEFPISLERRSVPMSDLTKALFSDIRPSLVYDIIKYLVLGAIALLVAAFTYIFSFVLGYPPNIIVAGMVGAFAFLLMIIALAVARYTRTKELSALPAPPQTLSKATNNEGKMLDYVQQIKNLTTERDQYREASARFQNESVELRKTVEKHGCLDSRLHEIADAQAAKISDAIEVIGVRVWSFELNSALPTIKCGVLWKNTSMFVLSIGEEVTGDLYFNRHRLVERKITRVITSEWKPGSEGEIIFDQRLSRPEADLITSQMEGRFDFTALVFEIRSTDSRVQPQELRVSGSFRPRLNEELTNSVLEVRESDGQKESVLLIPRGQLIINQAHYGAGAVWTDVSDVLRSRIYNDGSRLRLSDGYNDMFGDPINGTPKILKIIYLYNGERFLVELPEDAKVTLPFPYVK